jgi:hypothetical protein
MATAIAAVPAPISAMATASEVTTATTSTMSAATTTMSTTTTTTTTTTRMGECLSRGSESDEYQTCCGDPVHSFVTHSDTSREKIDQKTTQFSKT